MNEVDKPKNQKKRIEKLIAEFAERLTKNRNHRSRAKLIDELNFKLTGKLSNRERANLIEEKRREIKKEMRKICGDLPAADSQYPLR